LEERSGLKDKDLINLGLSLVRNHLDRLSEGYQLMYVNPEDPEDRIELKILELSAEKAPIYLH